MTEVGAGMTEVGAGMTEVGAGMTWVGAGMTWVGAGMTWVGVGMTWVGAGMTWVGVGVTETGVGVTETGVGMTETGGGMTETGGGMTETGGGRRDSLFLRNLQSCYHRWGITPDSIRICGPVAQPGQSIGLLIRVSWVRIPAGLPLPLHAKRAWGDAPRPTGRTPSRLADPWDLPRTQPASRGYHPLGRRCEPASSAALALRPTSSSN